MISHALSDLVQQEVNRILKGQQSERVNFAHILESAGNICFGINIDSSLPNTCATCQVCTNCEFFENLNDLKKEIRIYMPDGNIKTASEYGNVTLNKSLFLKDVLYVPSFKFNLLSVGKILEDGILECFFYAARCTFQDQRTSEVVAMGKLKGDLYILYSNSLDQEGKLHVSNFSGSSDNMLFTSNNTVVDPDIWHSRLGHPSKVVSKHVDPLKNETLDNLLCEFCLMAKQTGLPFDDSSNISFDCFELLHIDIWGPYKQPSLFGASYFLTVIDEFTRCTWTFLMKLKSQTVATLKVFCYD